MRGSSLVTRMCGLFAGVFLSHSAYATIHLALPSVTMDSPVADTVVPMELYCVDHTAPRFDDIIIFNIRLDLIGGGADSLRFFPDPPLRPRTPDLLPAEHPYFMANALDKYSYLAPAPPRIPNNPLGYTPTSIFVSAIASADVPETIEPGEGVFRVQVLIPAGATPGRYEIKPPNEFNSFGNVRLQEFRDITWAGGDITITPEPGVALPTLLMGFGLCRRRRRSCDSSASR